MTGASFVLLVIVLFMVGVALIKWVNGRDGR